MNNGAKILVVDDEPSIVDAVGTALRYEGFDVQDATTGRDALASVTRAEPDLIVLDWMLPDLDGIEVARRLRERGYKSAILFLTAKDAVENKVDALRGGGDDYVTKPFSLRARRAGPGGAAPDDARQAERGAAVPRPDARRGAPRGQPG